VCPVPCIDACLAMRCSSNVSGPQAILTISCYPSVRLYVDENVFEVLQKAHINIGYESRDGMLKELSHKYRSLSTKVLEFI
jgi:hypothetical protein